jgi:hypothetical protein
LEDFSILFLEAHKDFLIISVFGVLLVFRRFLSASQAKQFCVNAAGAIKAPVVDPPLLHIVAQEPEGRMHDHFCFGRLPPSSVDPLMAPSVSEVRF